VHPEKFLRIGPDGIDIIQYRCHLSAVPLQRRSVAQGGGGGTGSVPSKSATGNHSPIVRRFELWSWERQADTGGSQHRLAPPTVWREAYSKSVAGGRVTGRLSVRVPPLLHSAQNCCCVIVDPGVGKSALSHTALQSCSARRHTVYCHTLRQFPPISSAAPLQSTMT